MDRDDFNPPIIITVVVVVVITLLVLFRASAAMETIILSPVDRRDHRLLYACPFRGIAAEQILMST
jgi:hypothetical protein